jgi:hypothetical protein
MKKAFVYVGHANWGKSFALKVLTKNSSHVKAIKINNRWVWVRKMSNDDDSGGLQRFCDKIPDSSYEFFVLAYCPNHQHFDSKISKGAIKILNTLVKSCELYFFIQRNKYSNPEEFIPDSEISYLKEIGTIQILEGKVKDNERASQFETFIQKYI